MGWRTYAMKLGEKGKTVRLGIIGLGGRGMSQTDTLLQMPDVEIVAVCDVYDDRVQKGQDLVFEKRGVRPDGETDYKKVLARPDIDAICVFTSWETHIDICVQAMRAGKRSPPRLAAQTAWTNAGSWFAPRKKPASNA